MGFNILPWIITPLLIGAPFLMRLWGRKPFLLSVAVSMSLLLAHFLAAYVPGWVLMVKADSDDPIAMYELARWTENHDEQIGAYILWPVLPDVLGGYAELEKSAERDYPPAVYALGVRLKYGEHVPRPVDWPGSWSGNYYPQPERGQVLIDKALRLGYQPIMNEKGFYRQQYRVRHGW